VPEASVVWNMLFLETISTVSLLTMVHFFTHPLLRYRELIIQIPPLLRVLEQKITHENIQHYNIKCLQYIPANISYLELCQLTLSSELGDPLAITKGLAVITFYFRPVH